MFERSPRGYYRAHGRADDTMNLGGIKVNFFQILVVKINLSILFFCRGSMLTAMVMTWAKGTLTLRW